LEYDVESARHLRVDIHAEHARRMIDAVGTLLAHTLLLTPIRHHIALNKFHNGTHTHAQQKRKKKRAMERKTIEPAHARSVVPLALRTRLQVVLHAGACALHKRTLNAQYLSCHLRSPDVPFFCSMPSTTGKQILNFAASVCINSERTMPPGNTDK